MLHTTLNDLVTKTNSAIFNPKKESDADSHPSLNPRQGNEEFTTEDEADTDLTGIDLSDEKDLENKITSINKKILSLAVPLEPGTL